MDSEEKFKRAKLAADRAEAEISSINVNESFGTNAYRTSASTSELVYAVQYLLDVIVDLNMRVNELENK